MRFLSKKPLESTINLDRLHGIVSINYLGTNGTILLQDYRNNQHEYWFIESDCAVQDGIIITADYFHVEEGYDFVKISDEKTEKVYTGDMESFQHLVDSTSFHVHFWSDEILTKAGFLFNWQCNTMGVTGRLQNLVPC